MKITSQLSSILLVLLIVSTWPLIWIKTTLIKRAEIKIPIFNQIPRFKLLLKFDPVFNLKKLNQDLKSVSHSFVLKSTSSSSFDLLRNGEYHFHFYCKLASQSSHYAVDIGPFRHITIKVRSECTQEIFNDITFPIISGIFANEFHLVPKNALYENLKTIKYSRNYQTTFNLLIADPATNKTTWDIKPALQKYISPFIKQYSSISNITVSTQILLYSTLSDSLKPEYSKRYNSNTLSSTQLSNFINGAEWNLANPVSSATPITFIHYIPSTPINIIKSNGELLPSNAFLIPRWGGVIIENNNPINIKKSMMIYISQLRQILGISKTWSAPSNLPFDTVINYKNGNVGVTLLELDSITRRKLVVNLNDAQETLVSLYNLIQEIPGMTVNENIQKQVLNSLNSINKCHELIDLGDFEGASLSAIDAVVYAEGAFFDGSLVSLLYFPVEHKYAVYMPFFVPALVPVFSSFFGYIKRARLGQV